MVRLEQRLKLAIRDVVDFPRKGIVFKDITTLLADPALNKEVLEAFVKKAKELKSDLIVGIDSRGFLYGNGIAMNCNIPFSPIRKKGKLPYNCIQESYDLEYGAATLEMHTDAVLKDQRVIIHDDLLATGGTALAAAMLVERLGGVVVGFSFIIHLSFLNGQEKLLKKSENLFAIATY